jgi:2-haloacid dehalogenase
MSIDTVVFDIGNVLLRWDRRNLYRKLIPDEAEMEHFLSEVCNTAWHEAQDAGQDEAEATAELVARFPDKRDLITAFYDRFPEMLAGHVDGMEQIVMGLKARGVPVYGLSNWPAGVFHHAEQFSILGHLDGIVVSGREKVKKPDPRIFQILFSRHGIAPQRALFVDDIADNVAAAISLGMNGHLFQDAARLRIALKGYQLLTS